MSPSGIRLGAFDSLRWKDVVPIIVNNDIVAAKLVVYPGDNEEYFTFMTIEAYNSVKEWMEYFAPSYWHEILSFNNYTAYYSVIHKSHVK